MATPLHHTWTYQAMAHDVLQYSLNRVTVTEQAQQEHGMNYSPKVLNRAQMLVNGTSYVKMLSRPSFIYFHWWSILVCGLGHICRQRFSKNHLSTNEEPFVDICRLIALNKTFEAIFLSVILDKLAFFGMPYGISGMIYAYDMSTYMAHVQWKRNMLLISAFL